MRPICLIAKTVWIEAIRRKEIYVIVLVVAGILLATGSMRFFGFTGMTKFYREISLQMMNLATALTVILLASRQLPREFERRTIYPLLAKPVSRLEFLAGKFIGVLGAGLLCYAIFILLFLTGMAWLDAPFSWGLFLQSVYLQVLALSVVASLSFMLSLLFNVDAAITVSTLVFVLGGTVSATIDFIHESVAAFIPLGGGLSVGEIFMKAMNYGVPQLTLFDLSAKVVHATDWAIKNGEQVVVIRWTPVESWVLGALTLYASFFVLAYLLISHLLFSRRAL